MWTLRRSIWRSRIVLCTGGALMLLVVPSPALSSATPIGEREFSASKIHNDGHFHPGGIETIRVRPFPGPGRVEIAFFPSAICEDECGAETLFAGPTDHSGKGILH